MRTDHCPSEIISNQRCPFKSAVLYGVRSVFSRAFVLGVRFSISARWVSPARVDFVQRHFGFGGATQLVEGFLSIRAHRQSGCYKVSRVSVKVGDWLSGTKNLRTL